MSKLNIKSLLNVKYLIVFWIVLILIATIIYLKQNTYILDGKKGTTAVLWLPETKKKEYIWKYVSTQEVDNKSVFGSWSDESKVLTKKDERDLNQVKSYIRTICSNYTKIAEILNSQSFQIMKNKITKIKSATKNKDNFLYVTLPELVSANCINSDDNLKDLLIRYLQSDYNDAIALDKENINKYTTYIDNIKLNSTANIDKTRIKNDKMYFQEVFFKDNLAWLEDIFFSEYSFLKDKTDEQYFKYFSILSLAEKNEILEKTLWKLTAFLKEIWIKDLAEFRNLILKNYWYWSSLEIFKTKMITDYKEFDKKAKEKWVNLTLELVDIDSLGKFYMWDKFKIIRDNKELYDMFNKIWLEHLHYSIISDKYADALNEWWSWKEQFWDSIIWNGLIRLWFLYLRETQKNLK